MFSGSGDWCAALERAIRESLYFPGKATGFPSGKKQTLQAPEWAGELEISFQDNLVSIRFRNEDYGNFPLFTDQLLPVLANWANNNPMENAVCLSGPTARDPRKCRDFLFAVVHHWGKDIRNRLLRMLKETKQPKFDIYCVPYGDAFSKERKLPVFGLAEISCIDIMKNGLKNSLGISRYVLVRIQKKKLSTAKAGPRGSFRAHDEALVEKMKELIDDGSQPSALQAAKAVLSEAPRRRQSSDESVIHRLQIHFSKRYPDHSNR